MDVEIEKQRIIGKQILIVNAIRDNTELEEQGFFGAHVTADDFSRWADMSKEEIDRILNACSRLYKSFVFMDAKCEFLDCEIEKGEKERGTYILFMYIKQGFDFIKHADLDCIDKYFKDNCGCFYDRYCQYHGTKHPVSEKMKSENIMKQAMEILAKIYVSRINELLEEGFDFDVIKAMLGFELSRERFEKFENYFLK